MRSWRGAGLALAVGLSIAPPSFAQDDVGEVFVDQAAVDARGDEATLAALRTRADAGDTAAMVDLGRRIEYGSPDERVLARQLFERAAKAGNPAGMVAYADGFGPDLDSQAFVWLRKAAATGDADAMQALAYRLWWSDLPKENGKLSAVNLEALGWWRKAARAGSLKAMNELADLHSNSELTGTDADWAGALEWRRMAAATGDPEAILRLKAAEETQAFLAMTPDQQEAHRRAEAAERRAEQIASAEAGDATEMYELGRAYQMGWGEEAPDLVQARRWYERALAAGNDDSAGWLADMYREGLGGPKNLAEADRLDQVVNERSLGILRGNFQRGHMESGWDLAIQYLTGKDDDGEPVPTPRNPEEGLRYLRLMAEAGDQRAMKTLGELLAAGTLVPKDEVEAKKWADRFAAIPQDQLDDSLRPVEDLIARAPREHPMGLYMLASRLMSEGRGQEGVRWLLLGKLRWRFEIGAHPKPNDIQGMTIADAIISDPIMGWALGDVDAFAADVDWALAWDEANHNAMTSKTEFGEAWRKVRAEFVALRDKMVAEKEDIRRQREEAGLANRR